VNFSLVEDASNGWPNSGTPWTDPFEGRTGLGPPSGHRGWAG
jgi:hypothetical protein